MQQSSITALRRLLSIARARVTLQARALSATGRFGPAIHSEHPQGDDAEEAAKSAAAEEDQLQRQRGTPAGGQETPLTNADMAVKSPPFASSPKLENPDAVGPPVGLAFQQKRRAHAAPRALDDVVCVGWDGGVGEKEEEEDEGDYREYYKGRKPSPLAELEFVDTRKPITRATDGDAEDVASEGVGVGMLVRETVEDALLRAERIFRETAARGDPDAPQSRALARALERLQDETRLHA